MATFKGYRVTSPYGFRTDPISKGKEFHAGVDLVKRHHSPIHAFSKGTVIYAGMGQNGTGLGGYGHVVLIQDQNNHAQLYAHLHRVSVQKGQRIAKDDLIGYQGSTGRVTGSHLHFEVRKHAENRPPYGYRGNKKASTLEPTSYLNQLSTFRKGSTTATLQKGSRGERVKVLQQKLLQLGYSLPQYGADSQFGEETEKAVRDFQKSESITVDGIVGPQTQGKLSSRMNEIKAYPGDFIQKGSSGKVVKTIQRKVGTAVDGIYGPKTEQAVKNYQKKYGLTVDGIVGPNTWESLF
ncbi:peptidoglycan-binding protein [Gracilibacillus sp. YIM 98692]|uniref:peptidoglycan-binding protein n=1 Tax=Gracilibacillus sp. YIM 98692 TaxID=2663532 RepID=UPI0013D34FFC|nr:peptidoglycan-binding protein [Gracilibacillus sp. YIM 98692]